MSIAVNLGDELVMSARTYSAVQSRSVAKQIEHWAKIGRLVEENPDLPYSLIKDILLGLEDVKNGNFEEYQPGIL